MQLMTRTKDSRQLNNHLRANKKLALRTLFALALMPRAPEGASACFGASAGILAVGPVEIIIYLSL
jgi:hypothetical protein